MIPSTVKTEIKIVVVTLIALVIFGAGWTVEGWRKDAEIARINERHQADQARATSETLGRVTAANKRSDGLAEQLAKAEQTRQTLAQEHYREIQRLTTGRACLSGAVVRLLNEPADLRINRALPQAIREPLRDDAPAATDTDVALWAELARRSYDTCRARLQAIADFYREPSPTAQAEAGAQRCADCGNQGNE